MKTLLISSSTNKFPTKRINLWFKYYHPIKSEFGADCIASGSATEITNEGFDVPVNICDGDHPNHVVFKNDELNLIGFSTVLERTHVWTAPGHFRAFYTLIQIAKNLGYDKVIYIESDCFVLSQNLANRIRSVESGAYSSWCKMYDMIEGCVLVICRDYFDALISGISSHSWDYWGSDPSPEKSAEIVLPKMIPITAWRDLIGDRYGEHGLKTPDDADYYAQASMDYVPVFKYVPQPV